MDNWKHRSSKMKCGTCMYFVEKKVVEIQGAIVEHIEEELPKTPTKTIGKCRRNAPTMKGWPVMFTSDWCGEHKHDEEKI